MPLIRTYLDSGVLILASRRLEARGDAARGLLDDPEHEVYFSEFVKLETLPKPTYIKFEAQVEYLEAFFAPAIAVRSPLKTVVRRAFEIATHDGLGAGDALHVSSATRGKCDELVSAELPVKAIYRAKRFASSRCGAFPRPSGSPRRFQ